MKQGWEYKKLGEVCDIINGKNQRAVENPKGIYPIMGSGGIIGYADDYLCNEGTTIIGRKGSINKPIYVNQKFWNVDTAFGLQPKEGTESRFLFYLCKSINFERYNKSVTIPSLVKSDLLKIDIHIPYFSVQKQIASELDLLSGVIEKQKAQLEELDKLAQSIFYDMFGDPVANEKGWEMKKLGEECEDMKYGTSRPACENGRYKYLRMGNITLDGHLDLADLKTIDIPEEEVEKCIVRYGDILFNRTNSHELIGKTCMFDLDEPMIIAGYIIRVRLSENLKPIFISIMFNLPSMKKLLRSIAKGAVNQANINSKELASINIIIPSLSLQQEFAAKVEAIEAMKAKVRQSLKEVETLFNERMDYYFN